MCSFCLDARPAAVHVHKLNHRRTRRSQSPSREVSPVPSYFSEPVSIRKRKVTVERITAALLHDMDTLLGLATCF